MDTRIHIDRSSHCSLTEQLADGLRTAIYSGVWKEGERIPTREQLVSDIGISKNVVQAAISRLVAEGLLRSRPHIGCTVVRPGAQPMKGQVLELISRRSCDCGAQDQDERGECAADGAWEIHACRGLRCVSRNGATGQGHFRRVAGRDAVRVVGC